LGEYKEREETTKCHLVKRFEPVHGIFHAKKKLMRVATKQLVEVKLTRLS